MLKRRTSGLIAIIFTILAGVGYIYYWASSPATSKIITTSTASSVQTLKDQKVSLANFSTVADGDMRIQQDKIGNGSPIFEQVVMLSNNVQAGDQVAITIGTLDSGGLVESSGIKLRTIQTDNYKPLRSFNSAPEGAIMFAKQNGYEKSVFWSNGNKYAAVVVSGNVARSNQLDALLAKVLKNWTWQ